MKKAILFLALIILFSSYAYALVDGYVALDDGDTNILNNGTLPNDEDSLSVGGWTVGTGKYDAGQGTASSMALYFVQGSYASFPDLEQGDYTVEFDLRQTGTALSYMHFGEDAGNTRYGFYISAGNTYHRCSSDGSDITLGTSSYFQGSAWHHIKMVWDNTGDTYTLYINNTQKDTCTATQIATTFSVNGGTAYIDNFKIYDGFTEPVTIYPNFEITAESTYWNQTLNTFEAIADGQHYSTTNGTIVTGLLQNATSFYNVYVWANNYDNKSFLSQNVSSNLVAGLDYYKYILNVSADDFLSGQINNFNISLNGTLYQTTNGTILVETDKNTNYGLSIDMPDYEAVSDLFFMDWWVKEYNYTLYWDYFNLNVTAIDHWGNTINTFIVNASGPDEVTGSTTSGHVDLHLNRNSTYDIYIDADGYALDNVSIYMDEYLQNQTFRLYTTNSISFIFEEEGENKIVDWQTINVELISSIFANNYTTANGTLYLDLLSPADYTIRYDADGFFQNFYYFTLVNRSHTNLTLYLVNSSIASEITATVYDYSNDYVEDAYIRTMRYDLSTNSYILVGEAKTNFEGKAILNLVKNTEFYKFLIYKPIGELRKETSPTYIYNDNINFQISLDDPAGTAFYNSLGIDHALTFNNATNNFKLTFSDSDGLTSEVCLEVNKINALNGTTWTNSTCLETASGTILIGVAAINGTTYIANAYTYLEGDRYFLESLEHTFKESNPMGFMGLVIVIILTLLFAFTFIFSLSGGIIVIPLPTVLGAAFNLIALDFSIAIGIEILAVILAIIVNRWDYG